MAQHTPIDLAERVATIARGLGIETVLIGAYALAAHRYVRATLDIDLATVVPLPELERLQRAVEEAGCSTKLSLPDDQDPLGGCLSVWEHADDDGEPIEPVEVVNYLNPFQPRVTPATDAIKHALSITEKPALRYPRLEDLIALKLYAGSLRDLADVVDVLVQNPDADLDAIRATCKRYGFEQIDDLIVEARAQAAQR